MEHVLLGGAGAHDLVKAERLRLVARRDGGQGAADDLRQAAACARRSGSLSVSALLRLLHVQRRRDCRG